MLPFLIAGGIAAIVATVAALSDDDSSSAGSRSGGAGTNNGDAERAERRRVARAQVQRHASDKLRALNEREGTPMGDAERDALAARLCRDDAGAVAALVDAAVRRAPFAREHQRELAALAQERARLLGARAVLETIAETA